MGNTKLNGLIRQAAFLSPVKDDFWPIPDQYMGVEIELEGQSRKEMNAHRERGAPFWAEHEDGSLRNGVEYTLNQAMMGNNLREAINYFYDNFTKFTASPRTSIHVHVNMRQDNETVEGLRNMVVLYYMYEDAFFRIADENRKWSSYCNAFEDNPPAMLEAIVNPDLDLVSLQETLHQSARTNVNRYYGLNLNALAKYGTIEFRHFPLVDTRERLIDWVKLIMELKLAANAMADAGVAPWDVFQTPDDIVKLTEYMPVYGGLLLGHVDVGRAFTRMVNVRNLGIRPERRHGEDIYTNPCFNRFLEVQKKQGKASKPVGKKQAKGRPGVAEAEAALAEVQATLTGRAHRPRIEVAVIPRVAIPNPNNGPEWAEFLTNQERARMEARIQAAPAPTARLPQQWQALGVGRTLLDGGTVPDAPPAEEEPVWVERDAPVNPTNLDF